MASFEEFSDPRLVALYDTVCPFAADTEFFLRLAARLSPSGEELVSANAIRFRDEAGLTGSLADAGFSVEHVYGDWDGQAAAAHTPELIFVAVSR